MRSARPLLAIAAMVSGCVPYPVYKTLQPPATATVRGQGNLPLPNAQVTLIARAHPSPFEQGRETKETLADGSATFKAKREMTVEAMALHGSLEYFWNWCVRKEGYTTFRTSHGSARDFQDNLVIRLEPGLSTPCPVSR